MLITTIAVSHPTVFVQMRPQSPSKHSVCVLALIRVRAVGCVWHKKFRCKLKTFYITTTITITT